MNTNLTIFSKYAKRFSVLVAVMGIATSFTACKTDFDNQQPENVSLLAVTNASTKQPSLDFYLDNQRANSQSIKFGTKTGFISAYSGNRTGAVTVSGTSTSLYSKKFTLETSRYHSLYVVDNTDSLGFVVVVDDFTAPAEGKAKIRFANLSADSPSLKMELEGDTTTFTDRAFKTLTAFKNVTPAKYKITLKNNATGAVVATLADVQIDRANFYTVWAKGLNTTTVTDSKLAIKVDKH